MKLLSYITCFALCSVITQAQAGPTISEFMSSDRGQAYFNCAYKGKTASKKCLVTHSYIKPSTNHNLKELYGAYSSEKALAMSIQWPDGDISRYAYVDDMEMLNLNDKNGWGYSLRTKDDVEKWYEVDYSRGLFIDKGHDVKDYIRLW